jgi:hypothetical protein
MGREECMEYLLSDGGIGVLHMGGHRNLIGYGKLDHDAKPTIAAEHLPDGISTARRWPYLALAAAHGQARARRHPRRVRDGVQADARCSTLAAKGSTR